MSQLVAIHERSLNRAINIPIDGFVKALSGAVARGFLTTDQAREITEDASLHITEGTAKLLVEINRITNA